MNISNIKSVKGSIIKLHGFFTGENEYLRGNNLILVTAYGIISGKFCEITIDEPEFKEPYIIPVQQSIIRETLKNIEEDITIERLYDEATSILLTDVTILHNAKFTNIPSLIVFSDQVIAVSVGNLSKE